MTDYSNHPAAKQIWREKNEVHGTDDGAIHSEFQIRRTNQNGTIPFTLPMEDVYSYSTMTPYFFSCTRTVSLDNQ